MKKIIPAGTVPSTVKAKPPVVKVDPALTKVPGYVPTGTKKKS